MAITAGFYQAAAALDNTEKWRDVVSQNIAASNVPGYMQCSAAFEGVSMGEMPKQSNAGEGVEMLEISAPEGTIKTSFRSGETAYTGVDTHLAINGKGFFEVSDEGGGKIYTRNGSFHFNSENKLVNDRGYIVSGSGGEINRIPGAGNVTITRDGRVLQGGQEISKIAVYKVNNPQSMNAVAGGFMKDPGGKTIVEQKEKVAVLQGYLEGSNVNPTEQMVQLIQVQHAQSALQAVISTYQELGAESIKYLGSG